MDNNMGGCESSACFTVSVAGGKVTIRGADMQWIGCAVDTVTSWRAFCDDIKAGKYDHLGELVAP